MELRHLEYFVAVAEEEHFTRAAKRLHIAQSGLSASIRALERELGAPLFVRSTRRVGLTEAGRALLAEARRTLASVAAARSAVAAVQCLLRGTLCIGTEQCLAVIDMPTVLASFRNVHPGVDVRLRQAGSAALVEDVRTGALDMAFVALAGGRVPTGVSLTPLASEPMMLVCHPDHPLGTCDAVDLARLPDEVFVDFHTDWGARQITDRAFGAAGLERQVALEVNDVHSLLDFVAKGLGVALVPRPLATKKNKSVRAVPLRGTAPSWVVSVAVPVNGPANPATEALLAIVEESTAPQGGSVPIPAAGVPVPDGGASIPAAGVPVPDGGASIRGAGVPVPDSGAPVPVPVPVPVDRDGAPLPDDAVPVSSDGVSVRGDGVSVSGGGVPVSGGGVAVPMPVSPEGAAG